jgi:hypothetical protein
LATDAPSSDRDLERPPAARPYSSAWVAYYDQASRRRHKAGGYRRFRAEVKRKRRLEIVTFVASGLSVLAVVGLCYAILSRAS